MEYGLLIFFGGIAAWMYFTTPKLRGAIFGYLILFAVLATLASLLTGQGPNSHY